jgi:CheY-like chemotaxis protein
MPRQAGVSGRLVEPMLNRDGLQRQTSGKFGCRILLVEDDEVTRSATECLLQELGLWVDTAQDGETAMEILMRRDFDMLLLDINLPSFSGYALSSWYVERQTLAGRPLATIVAVTCDGDEDLTPASSKEFGIDRCLTKPLTSTALAGALSSWFESAHLSPPKARPRAQEGEGEEVGGEEFSLARPSAAEPAAASPE